jgi:hypothetical protein
MRIPETIPTEALERDVGGNCLRAGRGKAWRDIKACLIALPPLIETTPLPSVSEPYPARTTISITSK